MPSRSEGGSWIAGHLFFDGGIYTPECDRVVLGVAEPFVRRCLAEGWAEGHFFIRYSEFGPHVRLRLYGDPAVLEEKVWPALEAHVCAAQPDVVFETPPMPTEFRSQVESYGTGRLTHLARIEYEPETERYGGPDGVKLAEEFFEVSSDAAYALLQRTGAERSSRLGKGLLSMVVLVHVFSRGRREHAADFSHQYGIGYLRSLTRSEDGATAWLGAFDSGFEGQAETLTAYVEEVWSRMDEGESLSEALDLYAEGLKGVRDRFAALLDAGRLYMRDAEPYAGWEQAVRGICSSYVHMMNNRLGISVQEEAYLAYLITRAMGRPVEAGAGFGGGEQGQANDES